MWSRVYVEDDVLHADVGRATAVSLPHSESERRWKETTSQWPMMHAVLHGVTRDQLMAKHKSNQYVHTHTDSSSSSLPSSYSVQVAYGRDHASADRAARVKAAMFAAMGIRVHVCGHVKGM